MKKIPRCKKDIESELYAAEVYFAEHHNNARILFLSNFHYTPILDVSPCVYCGNSIHRKGSMKNKWGHTLCLDCYTLFKSRNQESFKPNFITHVDIPQR